MQNAWKLRNNVDLVQINLNDSDGKFYLPENVDFRDKKINNIMLLTDTTGDGAVSPFDNKELVSQLELKNFYVELVSDKKKVLFENVNATLLSPYANLKLPINSVISLKLSSLSYVGSATLSGKCILLYVSYAGGEIDAQLPSDAVTINFTMQAGENNVKLSQYIDEYLRRMGKRVKAIETSSTYPYYLTLQENSGNVFRFVPSQMFDLYTAQTKHSQPLMLGNFDVDFKNSFISAAQTDEANNISLTFYY